MSGLERSNSAAADWRVLNTIFDEQWTIHARLLDTSGKCARRHYLRDLLFLARNKQFCNRVLRYLAYKLRNSQDPTNTDRRFISEPVSSCRIALCSARKVAAQDRSAVCGETVVQHTITWQTCSDWQKKSGTQEVLPDGALSTQWKLGAATVSLVRPRHR